MFVGYPTGQKGYKLYDLESKIFFVSRDVKFTETNFLFHSISSSPLTPTIPLIDSGPLSSPPHLPTLDDAPLTPPAPLPSHQSPSKLSTPRTPPLTTTLPDMLPSHNPFTSPNSPSPSPDMTTLSSDLSHPPDAPPSQTPFSPHPTSLSPS